MSAVWQGNVIDLQGNIVPAAFVTVRDQVSGVIVPIFQDFACTVPQTNPVVSDPLGFVRFYVANNGLYNIVAAKGGFTREWQYVLLMELPWGDYVPRLTVEPDPLVTGNNNNWNAEFGVSREIGRVRVIGDGLGTSVITGMNGGIVNADGRRIILTNFGLDAYIIMHESALSNAIEKFNINGDLYVPPGISHEFIYDIAILTGRWSKLGN